MPLSEMAGLFNSLHVGVAPGLVSLGILLLISSSSCMWSWFEYLAKSRNMLVVLSAGLDDAHKILKFSCAGFLIFAGSKLEQHCVRINFSL